MKVENSYNTVVIGSGPGGLFAMLELAKSNVKSLLVEKESTIGGMAFNTDLNLQDYEGLPEKSHLGERLFNSNDTANKLIVEVFNTLCQYGLPNEVIKSRDHLDDFSDKMSSGYQHVEHKTLPIKFTVLQKILSNMLYYLKNSSSSNVVLNSNVESIKKSVNGVWELTIKKSSGEVVGVVADNVIFATGKLSVLWLLETLRSLGIDYTENACICLGVRLEEKAERLVNITSKSLNPKIRIFKDNFQSETFCWCANGGVMSYQFYGSKILDGVHLHEKPSQNTSFGAMVTLDLPTGVSNVNFSLAFARLVNILGKDNITLQRLEDFKKGITTTEQSLKNNSVKPSLRSYSLSNIKTYLPPVVTTGILSLIDKINEMYGNVISEDCLLYAPIVERIFPSIKMSTDMETSQKGIFLVGDCSGKSIGVVPATIMGIKAARYIINNMGVDNTSATK